MIVSFTKASRNTKTGTIPVSVTEQKSCPDACPWKAEKLCYPYFSPLGFIWESLDTSGYYQQLKPRRVTPISWAELCNNIQRLPKGQLWRHNAAGDLPGEGDVIDLQKLNALVTANKDRRGFTYTHKPVGYQGQSLVNAQAIYAANKQGFRINLSADSFEQADKLFDMQIAPVVMVVTSDAPLHMKTPKGRTVIVCPAEIKNKYGEPQIQCDRCQLCAKERKAIVAFRAHGKSKKTVSARLRVI